MDATAPLHECTQKFEFNAGEIDAFTADGNLVPGGIDRNRAGGETFVFGRGFTATHDRPDAQNNFARAERLGHIIVGAEFQAHDSVDLLRFGR